MSRFKPTHAAILQHPDGTSTTISSCQIVPVKTATVIMTGGKALTEGLFDPDVAFQDGDTLTGVTRLDGASVGSWGRYNVVSWEGVAVIPVIKAILEGVRT